jgi:4-alpha-glucanotransferase
MPDRASFHRGRHAGVLVPLFSLPSTASWGIGEILDLPRFARWLEQARLDFVQLLPVNEMELGQNSPYSALSAMAIDPVYISIGEVAEFAERGGEASLDASNRAGLAQAREARAVDFRAVRALKSSALRAAFAVFRQRLQGSGSARERDFLSFADRERWWLDDYSLFRALHDEQGGRHWREWDPPLRDRDPHAIEHARQRLAPTVLYYQYLQWLADDQWRQARRDCGRAGIFGDFPFMVSGHSADVWSRQHEFQVDASVGVPPDPHSEAGQDWGLPAYRWQAMEPHNYEWLRQRARRSAELYDGFRIDHLVGFYRTFIRERTGRKYFNPPDEPTQLAQGERLMRLFAESGARLIAEDLGVVPDFVRESLARLRLPGLKVLRWERRWHDPGQPFRRPEDYPADSVAITATHDTETLAEWWDGANHEERRLCAELPGLRAAGCTPDARFSAAVRDALLTALFAAGSDFVIVPIQDVFGWRDRVNVPGVVNEENWTWKLPWAVDELLVQPEARERAAFVKELVRRSGRGEGE